MKEIDSKLEELRMDKYLNKVDWEQVQEYSGLTIYRSMIKELKKSVEEYNSIMKSKSKLVEEQNRTELEIEV